MAQSKVLGDGATHGSTDEPDVIQTQSVEERGETGGMVFRGIRTRHPVGLAESGKVGRKRCGTRLRNALKHRCPVYRGLTETVDTQDDRTAGASRPVEQRPAVEADVRHLRAGLVGCGRRGGGGRRGTAQGTSG